MDKANAPKPPSATPSHEYDCLTGMYTYAAAREKIDRLFERGVAEPYSCVLLRVKNTPALDREYGHTFTGAIIENISKIIKRHCTGNGRQTIVSRISRDTFMVFETGRSFGSTAEKAEWLCSEFDHAYFGRHTSISTGVFAGVCWHNADDRDYRSSIYDAGKALEYAQEHDLKTEVYSAERESEYGSIADTYMDIREAETDERLYSYDSRFVSFAVAMLSNAKDIQSSLDILMQRLGWRGRFLAGLVCKFENGHYIRVISRFVKGVGIVVDDEEETADINDWDAFFRSFNSSGVARIDDTSSPMLSESDREFFKIRGIGSALNFMLYDNGHPSGYLSLCSSEANREWDKESIDTFIQVSKIIGVFLSLRIMRENEAKRLKELSRDFVTGLYMYSAFHSEADNILNNYEDDRSYAFLYIDIDNFSYINNSYSLEAGNDLLKLMAERLDRLCREGGVCAHLQADKFVALLVRDSRAEIEEAVRGICELTIFTGENQRGIKVRSSTGVYFIEKNDCSLKNALDCATQVWKAVKADRSSSYMIYDEEFRSRREKRLSIISSYQQAIRDGEITAFLQPKFSMNSWETVGAEALCRWRMANGAYRLPCDFIPALEENGQIIEIDFCVYEQILKAMKRWKDTGKHLVPVSVNFSRLHFDNDDFVDRLTSLAKLYDVDTKYIELEITESAVSMSGDNMLNVMQKLREKGFKIEMDDFGTGYSSLNMLIEAPVDVVKIDKSFIDRYNDPIYRDYIDNIGSLITTARKDILFEGVETEDQINFLTDRGYDTAQGYAFSRPVPVTEFEKIYIHDEK